MFENCIEKKAADVKVGENVCYKLCCRIDKHHVESIHETEIGLIGLRCDKYRSTHYYWPEELVYVAKK